MMAFLYFHIDSQTGIHKREKSAHWIPHYQQILKNSILLNMNFW